VVVGFSNAHRLYELGGRAMKINMGAYVRTGDGQHVGEVHRVVVNLDDDGRRLSPSGNASALVANRTT
jgi:hypothetical protein